MQDQDVPQHLLLAGAECQRGVLVDRIEIERGALGGDIENDDHIEGDEADRARPPTPNQMSRKGAAMRIGTVPAVIMIGSIAARTNQMRAVSSPTVTPIAEPANRNRHILGGIERLTNKLGSSTP